MKSRLGVRSSDLQDISLTSLAEKLEVLKIGSKSILQFLQEQVEHDVIPNPNGTVQTDYVEFDTSIIWQVSKSTNIPIPPCVNPTSEPEQYNYEAALDIQYAIYTNSFEEGITDYLTLNNAEIVDWDKPNNSKVLGITPGGYVETPENPMFPGCYVWFYIIGCPGDVVNVWDSFSQTTQTIQMTGDWIKVDLSTGVGPSYIRLKIEAPNTNQYPIFMDSMNFGQCY